MIVGPIVGGWLVARFMSYRSCLLLWIGLITIMYFMLAWPHDVLLVSSVAIPTLLLLGIGLGGILPLMTVAIQNSVDKSNIGSATASLGLARSLGSLIGGVLFGIVYSSALSWQLLNTGLSNTTIHGLLHNGAAMLADLPDSEHSKVVEAFSNAFNILFLGAGILAAVSWGVILLMKKRQLSDCS
jgi:predicted MFS family arabinose efflux permease